MLVNSIAAGGRCAYRAPIVAVPSEGRRLMIDFGEHNRVPVEAYEPHEFDEVMDVLDRARIRHEAAAADREALPDEDPALD
jgi:hypothetical protein